MRLLGLLLLAVVLAGPPEAESCGPFLPSAQFSYVSQPPQGVFAGGQLGILRPRYYRRYLVVAYRYLSGVALNAEEMAAFDTERAPEPVAAAPQTPVEQWIEARNKVPGAPAVQRIDQFRQLPKPSYQSYENCLDDAFARARHTLDERTAKWGAASTLLKEWVRGQDAVFQNCDQGETMPPAVSGDADALLKADHEYQVAAAEFYSEKYEAAEKDFGAIAREADSPWQDIGEYMLARTLIREATVQQATGKFEDARRVLDGILANPQLAKRRASAEGLKEFVSARLDGDRQIQAMSERLMRPESGAEFSHALTDFTMLVDTRTTPPPNGATELVDWIQNFQAQNWEQALERWRAHPTDAWLVAALSSVPHDNPAVPQLLDAARRVPEANPAWASAVFYGISLELARNETESARRWADQALAAKAPPDVRNQFLAERMQVASTWEEFLRYGPRTPVAVEIDVPDGPIEFIDPELRERKSLLDADFTTPFNHEAPLDRWVDAASNALLPTALQADIAQAGWVRAVVLGELRQARALAPRLAALRPQLREPLENWLNEKDPKAAKFQAVLLMLRTPGLQPMVRENYGRETGAIDKIDQFRDNWWDLSERVPPPVAKRTPQFLTAPERVQGQKEWRELTAAALQASDYLCGETVAWARAHPDDPRVPEALHLAVRTTRFTSGEHTTAFPKQAFTLLHLRYPKSKWTALTPYWY